MAQRYTFRFFSNGWRELVVCLILAPCLVESSISQPFFFGNERPRTNTAVIAGVSPIDFRFNGGDRPDATLDFSAMAYGVTYSKSNLFGSVAFGRQNSADSTTRDLSLVDLTLGLWGDLFFSEAATSAAHRIFVPIMLFANYRKVSPRGSDLLAEFNITTLGLGLGLGYYGAVGSKIGIEARATPGLGYGVQSFGDASGLITFIDNDVQVHIGSVFDNIGISLGYTLRIMVWDIRVSGAFAGLTSDLYDYKDVRHTVGLGVNW